RERPARTMPAPLVRLFIATVLITGAYDAARVAISYRVLALGGDSVAVGLVASSFARLPMLVALSFGRLVDLRRSSRVRAARVAISYLVLALGGDAVAVGLVASRFALLPMLVALSFGRLVDRRCSWGVLGAGAAVSAAAVALAAVSPTIAVLAAANAAMGLGQVMTLIGAQGFVMELTERSRHVNGFAMFTLAVSVGQTLGTPAMGLLLRSGRGDDGTVATGPGLAVMAVAIAVALPFCLSLPRNARRSGQASRAAAASMPALVRRTGMVPSIFAALI